MPIYKNPSQLANSMMRPKKTVGEDLSNLYNKEFFKIANGDKEQFINHMIGRFGIPKGSTRAKEIQFHGGNFDKMALENQKKNSFLERLKKIPQENFNKLQFDIHNSAFQDEEGTYDETNYPYMSAEDYLDSYDVESIGYDSLDEYLKEKGY